MSFDDTMRTEHGLKRIVSILSDRRDRGELPYMTILSPHDVMTFSSDNWEHFAPLADKLVGMERRRDDCRYAVIARRFEDPRESGPNRRKSVAGLAVVDGRIISIPADEMEEASARDATIGARVNYLALKGRA